MPPHPIQSNMWLLHNKYQQWMFAISTLTCRRTCMHSQQISNDQNLRMLSLLATERAFLGLTMMSKPLKLKQHRSFMIEWYSLLRIDHWKNDCNEWNDVCPVPPSSSHLCDTTPVSCAHFWDFRLRLHQLLPPTSASGSCKSCPLYLTRPHPCRNRSCTARLRSA